MLNPGPTGWALSLLLTVRPTLSSAQSRILIEIGSNSSHTESEIMSLKSYRFMLTVKSPSDFQIK